MGTRDGELYLREGLLSMKVVGVAFRIGILEGWEGAWFLMFDVCCIRVC